MKLLLSLVAAGVLLFSLGVPAWAQATTPAQTDPLTLNPASQCMEGRFSPDQPQEERQIPASAVIEALRGGHCLRLDYAVVQGNLDLSTLSVNGVDQGGEDLVHVVGAFVVTHSQIEGKLNAAKTRGGPRLRFEGPVVFDDSQLAGGADLSGAQFADEAHFDGTTFAQSVKFDRASFEKSVSFVKAQFPKPVLFTTLTVSDTLDFGGATFSSLVRAFGVRASRVVLNKTQFRSTTDLSSWVVNTLDAARVSFDNKVDFKGGVWGGTVDFTQARFGGNVDFSGGLFNASTSFAKASFEKNGTFTKTRFWGELDFSATVFQFSAMFNQAKFFDVVSFRDAHLDFLVRFIDAQFYAWVDFGASQFKQIEMQRALFLSAVAPNWRGATVEGPINASGLNSSARWRVEQGALKDALERSDYVVGPQQPAAAWFDYALLGVVSVAGLLTLLLFLNTL